jgi:hypothetical protein
MLPDCELKKPLLFSIKNPDVLLQHQKMDGWTGFMGKIQEIHKLR